MNQHKHLDSCIQKMQEILGDPTNELESAQQRTITEKIRKLKKLKKQPKLTHEAVLGAVSEVAEAILEIM